MVKTILRRLAFWRKSRKPVVSSFEVQRGRRMLSHGIQIKEEEKGGGSNVVWPSVGYGSQMKSGVLLLYRREDFDE